MLLHSEFTHSSSSSAHRKSPHSCRDSAVSSSEADLELAQASAEPQHASPSLFKRDGHDDTIQIVTAWSRIQPTRPG